MKITEYDSKYFEIVPEAPSERRLLDRFPAFIRSKRRFLFVRKPLVIRNILSRLKKVYAKPIASCKSFYDMVHQPEELLEIPSDFPWMTEPLKHQLLSLRYLYTYGSHGLLLEPGLGKTFVVLNYIKLMEFTKSLVVCPKALCFVWVDEVAKHRPDIKIHVMKSTTWDNKIASARKRLEKWSGDDPKSISNRKSAERDLRNLPVMRDEDLRLAAEADIVVVNYEKVAPGMELLSRMTFDMIAVDEGLIKDPSTNRTKAITKLSTAIPVRLIMSGTLINNGPLDAYAPIKFMEPSLVGTGYSRFETYYARFSSGSQRFVVGMSDDNIAEIRSILESCSLVMTKEWLELPGKHFHPIYIDMTDEQRSMYNELQSNYIACVDGGYVEVDNALTMAGKLHQICNGFVYADEVQSLKNNKRAELGKLLEDLTDRKVIVWYNYSAELAIIDELLEELGIQYILIRGGTKDTGANVKAFNSSSTVRVMVCQAQSVNYGITVLGRNPEDLESNVEIMPDFDTRCYTQIFWSLSYSLERFIQQQDRIHRIGQTMPCDYYVLIVRNSIEEFIWGCLADKKVINEAMLIDVLRKEGTYRYL